MKRKRSGFLAALVLFSCVSCATAGEDFSGLWSYRKDCGFGHMASLDIRQEARLLVGSWSDGTRVGGDAGQLRGDVNEKGASVQFCSEVAQPPDVACPAYQDEGYLKRVGEQLVWYRLSGGKSVPYLTLDRIAPGGETPVDSSNCQEESSQD